MALEAAERLRDIDWASVPVADLPAVTALVARAVRHGEAALLTAAGMLEATGAAGELGWANAKDFLTHVTGGHQGTGGGLVRLATQVADLPDLAAALEAGTVSLPQARAIVRQVTTLPRDEQLRAEATTAMVGHGHRRAPQRHRPRPTLRRRHRTPSTPTAPGSVRTRAQGEAGTRRPRCPVPRRHRPDGRGGVKIKGFSQRRGVGARQEPPSPRSPHPRPPNPVPAGVTPTCSANATSNGRRLDPGCPEPGVRPRRPRPPRPRRPHLGRPRRAAANAPPLRRSCRRATAPRPGSSSPSTQRTSPTTCPT